MNDGRTDGSCELWGWKHVQVGVITIMAVLCRGGKHVQLARSGEARSVGKKNAWDNHVCSRAVSVASIP